MPGLEERDYTYFTTVRGMCRFCRKVVPARVFFRGGKVWQESLCPDCKNSPALIASDKDWFLENTLRAFPDSSPLPHSRPPVNGCPHDCGPCSWHASPCQLPVLSVTNACNLRCPICFTYNRKDRLYFMTADEMKKTVDWIIKSSGRMDLINITGGEPTMHPDILGLVERCRRPEIGRVTMNSNGIRLAEDYDLCRRLGDLGVYVVLSFNTFKPEASIRMHGANLVDIKLKAIDNLTRAGVRMTLLNVLARGVNEDSVSGIIGLMRGNDNILSITVQTMTHTGQGGGRWPERAGIPVDEAARIFCRESGGVLEFGDFMPRPRAHPLCYLTSYMLKSGEALLPLARFIPKEDISKLMADSYLIRMEGGSDSFKDGINELFARGDKESLKMFRALVEKLFPASGALDAFERQRISESAVRTVYIHSHMDEDTFDCSRAALCPDLVPAEPGRLIPACTYNLFYRMKDERFYA